MRLWPRGVRKEAVDAWEKDLAPSVEVLRSYLGARIVWAELARRYRVEMRERAELIDELAKRSKRKTVTLLCSCKDESRCHRSLLKAMVERRGAVNG